MKKISIILACVIILCTAVAIPAIVTGQGDDTVTAEATEEVVAETIATTTTEATTEQVEEITTVETTITTIKETTTKSSTTKQESKTTTKSSTTSTTEKTTEKTTKGQDIDGYYQDIKLQYSASYNITSKKLTRSGGVNYYNGNKETWYSEKVLPGGGLKIPGRHVAEDGTIRDEDGYICVAANPSYKSYGSRLLTSLGPAKVYDSGCDYGTIDIYVSW